MRRVFLVLILFAGLTVALAQLPITTWANAFFSWVEELGAWAPVVYVLVYVAVTVCFLPTWIFSVGGGVLFGVAKGIPLVLLGAMIGATLAFLLGRTLLREPVERWVASQPRLRVIDGEIERRGWIMAALLRLSPLVPYNLLNYALGLTSLSLKGYVISLFGMLPIVALYVSIGTALGDAATGGQRERTTAEWVILGVGIVATLVVTVWLGRVATRTASVEETTLDRKPE